MAAGVKGREGVHRGLTRADVLRAATRILDADGRAALTMRRLADDLGVKAPSLYVHVRSKEELLTGVLDDVLGEVALPPVTRSWRSSLVAGFGEYRRVLVRHPGAVTLLTERTRVSPVQVRLVERSIELLERAGLRTEQAVGVHVTLVAYTLGFVLQEVAPRPAPVISAAVPIATSEVFARAVNALAETTVDQRYRAGLELVLDGANRRSAQGGRTSASRLTE